MNSPNSKPGGGIALVSSEGIYVEYGVTGGGADGETVDTDGAIVVTAK